MDREEGAVSEITAEILIVSLVVGLGIAIFVIMFGIIPQIPTSAYLATDVSFKKMPGYSAMAITHLGGDMVTFIDPGEAPYFVRVYVDTPYGSYLVVPDATTSPFRTGNTVYIYYNGSGYGMTSDLAGVPTVPLPSAEVRVRIVDDASGLLIKTWSAGTSGTQTPTGTETPTSTATLSATSTPTTAAPELTRTVTVIWSPSGYGYGSESPPVKLANSQEVRVPRGSSKTIYFVPNAGYAVLTIKLDGTTVYSGSSVGSTISYTITNIVEDRTITTTFG
ncbi:hypothetical protein [uncultured Methanoregula sp.]|uniref:hypothetical protein n=1 Tax=uncultured Methanoregula sp. TaxID=1005933 RepID=UPI003748164B